MHSEVRVTTSVETKNGLLLMVCHMLHLVLICVYLCHCNVATVVLSHEFLFFVFVYTFINVAIVAIANALLKQIIPIVIIFIIVNRVLVISISGGRAVSCPPSNCIINVVITTSSCVFYSSMIVMSLFLINFIELVDVVNVSLYEVLTLICQCQLLILLLLLLLATLLL